MRGLATSASQALEAQGHVNDVASIWSQRHKYAKFVNMPTTSTVVDCPLNNSDGSISTSGSTGANENSSTAEPSWWSNLNQQGAGESMVVTQGGDWTVEDVESGVAGNANAKAVTSHIESAVVGILFSSSCDVQFHSALPFAMTCQVAKSLWNWKQLFV